MSVDLLSSLLLELLQRDILVLVRLEVGLSVRLESCSNRTPNQFPKQNKIEQGKEKRKKRKKKKRTNGKVLVPSRSVSIIIRSRAALLALQVPSLLLGDDIRVVSML